MSPRVSALILAAGSGSRMRSNRPKPVHLLCGRPMLVYVLDAVTSVHPERVGVVVGSGAETVSKKLVDHAPDVALDLIEQRVPSGTGDAAAVGLTVFDPDLVDDDHLLVVPGDTPLVRPVTVARLLLHHLDTGASATVLTAPAEGRAGYGSIVRDRHGQVAAVATPVDDVASTEIATGLYCFRRNLLAPALRRVRPEGPGAEVRLDAVVRVLADTGHPVEAIEVVDPVDVRGVNDRIQLAQAEAELRRRTNDDWLAAGVTMVDPDRTYIDATVELAPDVTLFPGTILQGRTVVGEGAEIGPDTQLVDCAVGARAVVRKTMARDSEVGPGAIVGPFAELQPGAQVPADTVTGPFFSSAGSDG